MKKLFYLLFVAATVSALTTITSCDTTEEDPCEGVSCLNGGTCNNGTCDCAAGYEGDSCSVEMRTKFIGAYTATETGSASGNSTFAITITNHPTEVTQIRINNMWGQFVAPVIATVDGNNLTIADQVPDNDGYHVSGSGSISGSVITVSYTVTDPANNTDNVTGTWN